MNNNVLNNFFPTEEPSLTTLENMRCHLEDNGSGHPLSSQPDSFCPYSQDSNFTSYQFPTTKDTLDSSFDNSIDELMTDEFLDAVDENLMEGSQEDSSNYPQHWTVEQELQQLNLEEEFGSFSQHDDLPNSQSTLSDQSQYFIEV